MPILRFWKPYHVLTQFTDSAVPPRRTLADFISVPNVYAAGRLDYDSEGLLILTDDGAMNARLTHPQYQHPRSYWVQVERVPDAAALENLRAGVQLQDGPTRPAQVLLLDTPPPLPDRDPPIRHRLNVLTAWLALTLTEGRNRQVRRMTAAVGYPTLRLVRYQIGADAQSITLDGLRVGEWQALSAAQVRTLRGR
jgi:pseudouridine synthase